MPTTNLQAALITQRIRPDVQALQAYHVQPASGMVKLDAMENPYSLPPELQTKLGAALGEVAINRYPAERVELLRQALMQHNAVPEGFDLMLGNGSDELISLVAMACNVRGASGQAAAVLAPEPGFVMYGMSAQLLGLQYVGVPLSADFELDLPVMLAAIAQHRPAITYLAYPNNPTANLWRKADIDAVIAACAAVNGLVVVDEAYQPFSADSYAPRLAEFDNVLLMRTLSKFGLAGVRLGYLIGRSALVAQLNKVRPPYNISNLNAECALFCLGHVVEFAQQAARIKTQRTFVSAALDAFGGCTVFPSQANMILVRIEHFEPGAATQVFNALKDQGVLIKNVSANHPLLRNCLRLTVGSEAENTALLTAWQVAMRVLD